MSKTVLLVYPRCEEETAREGFSMRLDQALRNKGANVEHVSVQGNADVILDRLRDSVLPVVVKHSSDQQA